MASFTQVTKRKRSRRANNAGRARKNASAERSTLSAVELFAALGDPGKPAAQAAKPAASAKPEPAARR